MFSAIVLAVVLAAPGSSSSLKETAELKSLIDRMQTFYDKTEDFTAHFQQQYTYPALKRVKASEGEVTFKKPGMMRWDYRSPSPKVFVLSDDNAYAYDPESSTLTKSNFNRSQLSAAVTFLWGKGHLADEFSFSRASCEDCKGTLMTLTPLKPDPRFHFIRLEVDRQTAQVLRTVVVDPDGSENSIRFSDLKINQKVKQAAFKLNLPPETQILDLNAARAAPSRKP